MTGGEQIVKSKSLIRAALPDPEPTCAPSLPSPSPTLEHSEPH